MHTLTRPWTGHPLSIYTKDKKLNFKNGKITKIIANEIKKKKLSDNEIDAFVILPLIFVLKMLSIFDVCFHTCTFFIKANNMNSTQTAPKGSGSI